MSVNIELCRHRLAMSVTGTSWPSPAAGSHSQPPDSHHQKSATGDGMTSDGMTSDGMTSDGMTSDELDQVERLTKRDEDSAAVKQAGREFVRVAGLRELKTAAGRSKGQTPFSNTF